MEVLLAVDGGGTKTEVILLSKEGEVLAVKKYEGTNINSVGMVAAVDTLEKALLDFSKISFYSKKRIVIYKLFHIHLCKYNIKILW